MSGIQVDFTNRDQFRASGYDGVYHTVDTYIKQMELHYSA